MTRAKSPKKEVVAGTGRVLEVSRRLVTLLSDAGDVIRGTLSAKSLDFVVGDLVSFKDCDGGLFVTSDKPAKRCLYRTFNGKLKRMGANIDALCVITAAGPTWNPVAIDRMIAAGNVQSIPTTLIVNKIDLGLEEISKMIDVYSGVGISVIRCSVVNGVGIDQVRNLIDQSSVRIAALCGVSGVGKSSILNAIIPGAQTRTGNVSKRSGQGKQTTSQSRGFLYQGAGALPKIIVDLPGVQFFGLSHLAPNDVALAFDEISRFATHCKFRDCAHIKERECAVRDAVTSGEIAGWRYQSYLQILKEIDEAKEY